MITAEYERVDHHYRGRLLKSVTTLIEFRCYSFTDLCEELALHVRLNKERDVSLLRTDGATPFSYKLSDDEVHALCTDPQKFAADCTPQSVVVRVRDRAPEVFKYTVRAGYDTLADAFGDTVYMRVRNNEVESPFDGRWHRLVDPFVGLGPTRKKALITFKDSADHNGHQLLVDVVNDRWAYAPTKALIACGEHLGTERYYLPRVWNVDGLWITHAALVQSYDQYKKEKDCGPST